MKAIYAIVSVLFLASCSAVRVHYDYDKETDFSNYSTYNYYPDMETGLSQLDAKRLLDAVDNTMRAKGFLLSEEPDFFINIQSKSVQTPQNNTVGVGLGGSGRSVGGGISVGIPMGQPNQKRQIQFDFVDSQKDDLFWQGVSEGSYKENATPEVRGQKFLELVEKVFSKYPPKQRN